MKYYIYGAGILGEKCINVLIEKGYRVEGFLDTYKSGNVTFGERSYDIVDINSVEKDPEARVIVAIGETKGKREIENLLKDRGIICTTLEEAVYEKRDIVERNRNIIADYHMSQMDDYFFKAESDDALKTFWGEKSIAYRMFSKMDLSTVVELACGKGRHVSKYSSLAGEVILVDILEKNIDFCRERFNEEKNIKFYKNNGYDLAQLKSGSVTALFTYDSMVHFELLDIFNYLKETARILKNGGMALFHHSNNTENYKITFTTARHGRNYMSKDLFAYLANRAGLEVLEQQVFDWDTDKDLDCLTLVQKKWKDGA